MRRKIVWFVLGLSISWTGFGAPLAAEGWIVENPTGEPTLGVLPSPPMLVMRLPARSGGMYNGYDMAAQVNYDAPRLYRPCLDQPFVLVTGVATNATGFTYLSGLYLYSDDGDRGNDLVFGANGDSLKVDRGDGDWTISDWQWIGTYNGLLLGVASDGAGTFSLWYKILPGGDWTLYTELGAAHGISAFTHVGMITKTWSLPNEPSPEVLAGFFTFVHH